MYVVQVMVTTGTQTDLSLDPRKEDRILVPSTTALERDANKRMMQPPPPPPPQQDEANPANEEVNESANLPPQQKSKTIINKDYSDGYGLFHINQLSDFIQELAYHAAQCSGVVGLESTNFKYGAGITQTYKCSCKKKFVHKNCKWIKTDVVEEGRKYSRTQPELNVRIVKAAREVGVNLEKLCDLLAYMGIKTSA